MIPVRPDGDCAASERALFGRMADALPANWTVIHSRTITLPAGGENALRQCEIDFLVLDPSRGLLALEVKGGAVQRDSDDLWYSIDRDGTPHEIHNPQKQVTRNVRYLREWLKAQPIIGTLWLPIAWGVAFPDITVPGNLGPDLPRELILDRKDLDDVEQAINRIFEANGTSQGVRASKPAPQAFTASRHPEPAKRGEGSQVATQEMNSEEPRGTRGTLLGPAQTKLLIDTLAPTIRLTPTLSDRMREADAQLVRLTAEQAKIFDFNGNTARLKVKGTAGSGKTLVAMERARREAAAGKSVLFLCYNTLLAQWLRGDGVAHPLEAQEPGVRASKPAPALALASRQESNSPRQPEPAMSARHPEPAKPACHPEPAKRGEGSFDTPSAKVSTALGAASQTHTAASQTNIATTQTAITDDVTPSPGTITLLTFHDLAKKLAKKANLRFAVPGEGTAKQAFWNEDAPDLLTMALEKLPDHRWDSIVVDEAQDFRELWWYAIDHLAQAAEPRSAGVPRPRPEESRVTTQQNQPRNSEEPRGTRGTALWAFYDPHQDIYAASAMDALIAQEAQLEVNCRNTARIAAHAFAEIGEQPTLKDDAPEGVPVETIQCANDAEMKDAVRRTLHKLVHEEKLDPSRVVVLTARNADKSILRGETLANLKLVDWPATNKNEIGYCSLQRFKGLEADVVVLCEVDRTKNNGTNKHLYVAQSRARQMLIGAEFLAPR